MATGTAWYNLTKAASNERYNLNVVNTNLDMIDEQMHQNETEVFTGATDLAAGTVGNVPAPEITDKEKFLKGDGTWATPSGGGGGSSTLDGLTDVNISSPTDGQALVYDETNQVWVNGDIDPSHPHRDYLGQLINRVSAEDSKITASNYSTSWGTYYPWMAFNGVSPSDLRNPGTNCWLGVSTNEWIQYHFEEARYFTQMVIKCFSNYSGDWVGDIKIEGSNDGNTWTNILASGQTYELTADLAPISEGGTGSETDVTVALDDADTWTYIRLTFVDAMSVAYQPSCYVDEIYVYGGKVVQGIDGSIIDFTQITGSQTFDIMTKLNSGIGNTDSGTFTTGTQQYDKVEVNCGFRPTYIQVILPFSNGDTTATYDASVSTTTSTWYIPMESRTYTIDLGSAQGETGITDITDTGFKFRCNAPNTRNVQCTYSALINGQTYIQTVDFDDISATQGTDILSKLDFTNLTAQQIADLKTALGIS